MDKGQRAIELMFRAFEEAASADGEQSPEIVDTAPAVGWESPAAALSSELRPDAPCTVLLGCAVSLPCAEPCAKCLSSLVSSSHHPLEQEPFSFLFNVGSH